MSGARADMSAGLRNRLRQTSRLAEHPAVPLTLFAVVVAAFLAVGAQQRSQLGVPHRSRLGLASPLVAFSSVTAVTAVAAFALVPLAGACSSDRGAASLEEAGGDGEAAIGDIGETAEAPDAFDAGPPRCLGVPLPAGDLAPEGDGRTQRVACAALGFDVAVTVLDPSVVRIRHVDAAAPARASFAVVDRVRPDPSARFGSTASTALVCAGQLLVEIDRASCRVRATQADGTVVLEDADEGGYLRDAATGARGALRKTPADERFYGLGERTGPLDKRGRAMTFWNTDAYQDASKGYPPGADPLYQSIPFFAADGDGAPAGTTTMAAMHNVYGLNEARATFEGMRAAAPNRRPFVLTRAGYAGIQRYAAVWTGDAPSTWPTLRETLPMMLGMGLSGVPARRSSRAARPAMA